MFRRQLIISKQQKELFEHSTLFPDHQGVKHETIAQKPLSKHAIVEFRNGMLFFCSMWLDKINTITAKLKL